MFPKIGDGLIKMVLSKKTVKRLWVQPPTGEQKQQHVPTVNYVGVVPVWNVEMNLELLDCQLEKLVLVPGLDLL
jgi:hypothetical protein